MIAPLAAPGMFTSAILVFIFAWNDFLFATALTSTNRARTVPAAITFFTGASQFDFPPVRSRRPRSSSPSPSSSWSSSSSAASWPG